MKNYQIGDICEGTIINIRDFGAIMIFEDDTRGLLHISEIANVFIRNIHKYLKIGKTYQVKIIGIEEDGFLKLSMSKITDEEKEIYHKNGIKKAKIDPDFIDYTALKENLEQWIINERNSKND